MKKFLLAEDLLLLALDDEKGKIIFSSSTALPYGLAGAILLQLSYEGKISLNDDRVNVVDSSPVNIPILDQCLSLITDTPKPKKVQRWLTLFSGRKVDLKNQLIQGLITKDVIKETEHKILYLIPSKRYPMINGTHENQIRQNIKNIVLNQSPSTQHFTSLISLIHACELINEIFDKSDRKQAKQNIKKIIKNEKVGDSVTQKVNEIILAAVMVSIITTTTTTSN